MRDFILLQLYFSGLLLGVGDTQLRPNLECVLNTNIANNPFPFPSLDQPVADSELLEQKPKSFLEAREAELCVLTPHYRDIG